MSLTRYIHYHQLLNAQELLSARSVVSINNDYGHMECFKELIQFPDRSKCIFMYSIPIIWCQ